MSPDPDYKGEVPDEDALAKARDEQKEWAEKHLQPQPEENDVPDSPTPAADAGADALADPETPVAVDEGDVADVKEAQDAQAKDDAKDDKKSSAKK